MYSLFSDRNKPSVFRSALLIPIFLILCGIQAFSQQSSVKFGKVTAEDFAPSVYPIDSSAGAVVIYEKGEVNFFYREIRNNFFYYETDVLVRKRILKTSGTNEGILILPHYLGGQGYEEIIVELKGNTYNLENGEVKKDQVESSSIFTEKITENYFQKKITFPNVKPGSIIEYKYRIRTPLNLKDNPRTWYFQSEIPKLWSELVITIPSYFYYQKVHGGYLPLHIMEQDKINITDLAIDGVRYRMVVKDAPAFKEEPLISSQKDYLSKIDFELSSISFPGQKDYNFTSSWGNVDKVLLNSANWGLKLSKNNYLKDVVEVYQKIQDKQERLEKAYAFMISRFKWDNTLGLFAYDDLKKVYENKTGSASELNLIMVSFLRELGFDAHPFILSTRKNGKINPYYPSVDRFNYTLVYLDKGNNEHMLIDITDPKMKLGGIPPQCLNDLGRLVKSGAGENIPILGKEKHREMETFSVTFDLPGNKVSGTYSNSGGGYHAHALRTGYLSKGESTFKKEYQEKYKKRTIKNVALQNFEDLNKNTVVSFDFESDEEILNQDILYIDPMYFGKLEKTPFMKEKREFPVDFGYLTENMVMGTFNIPEGFKVEELPKDIVMSLPENGGKFTYVCSEKEGKIHVMSKLVINKPVFYAEEYDHIREFYKRIVQKHAEQIVLRKN